MSKLWEVFEEDLERAVRNDYLKIVKNLNENVYSVALVTDSFAKSLFLALNTYESLAKVKEKYIREIKPKEDYFKNVLKWTPSEWAYGNDDLNDSEIKNISHKLAQIDDSSDEFQAEFYESLTGVLNTLKNQGFSPKTILPYLSQ